QALAWGVPAAVMLWCLYRFGLRWRSLAMGALASALACVLIAWPPAHWVVAAAWLALLSLAYDAVMRICDERFPMTRFSGWVLWLGVLGTMLVSAAMLPLRDVPGMEAEQGLRIFTFGALRALEFVLAATVLWWGAAGLALLVAMASYLTLGFLPSVLAEARLLRAGATRLGRWLTAAFRTLDVSVALLVVLGSLGALIVGVSLNSRWFGPAWLNALNETFPQ